MKAKKSDKKDKPSAPKADARPWQTVLDFWFGQIGDDGRADEEHRANWFAKNPEFDVEIEEKFGDLRHQAIQGKLLHWENIPRGRLALIILIDQFSRNLYRGDARAFAQDSLARRWCLDGLAEEHDRRLRPVERIFFYMPLMHCESLAEQDRSVELFEKLLLDVPETLKENYAGNLDFAKQHRDIVAKFDRFPHRNEMLGRSSTPEELKFLKTKGSSF